HPDENTQCKLLGRIFCMVEEQRSAGVPPDGAIANTQNALRDFGKTGSHVVANYKPFVEQAAAYVYANDKVLPWTQYYYATYTCGVHLRAGDIQLSRALAPSWEQTAQGCIKQYPGEGDGYPNEPLRDCLEKAM